MPAVRLPLLTPRLALRAFTPADVAAAHAFYSDPEVMRFVGDGPAATVQDTAAWLRHYAEHQARDGFTFWAVVQRAGGALIGDAGLYRHVGREEIEVGWTLARGAWGCGYATEAGAACLAAAFGPLGLPEVVAVVDARNAASARVAERLGMAPAGRREAYGREHLVFRARNPG
jgi:ribosomal-protein-alanine N-acetyltransferase